MIKPKIVYKCPPHTRILLERLKELQEELKLKEDCIISYSYIRSKICRSFSVDKNRAKEILDYLHYCGFIKMNPKGAKLNFIMEEK